MLGIYVNFNDGVQARVTSVQINETYEGVLAGTLTVATKHILPRLLMKMFDLDEGKAKGYYCLPPELVNEAELMNYSEEQVRYLSEHTQVDKCLKELHANVSLNINDEDNFHLITIEWFLGKDEIENKPLPELIQEAIGHLSFEEVRQFCEDVDWADL